jgi:RNA polymerase sigma-70 factor (ECF subfamily)
MAASESGEDDRKLLERALRGEESALARLVERLTPVIQARVVRGLFRGDQVPGRAGFREVVEDLIQQVFVELLDRDARVLREWRPGRGLSLENFVGLIAERRVVSTLRRARRNPWTEEPTAAEELDRRSAEADPERRSGARERLRQLLDRLREELSPLGWRLFELLFLRERSVAEVAEETALSREAIYAWRSRLRRRARRLGGEDTRSGER